MSGSIAVNDGNGHLKIGPEVFMPLGTSVTAHYVIIGARATVDEVEANLFKIHPDAVVNGSMTTPTLPVVDPYCEIPATACGSQDVTVPLGDTLELPPGTYGDLRVAREGTIRLQPGTYAFCDVKIGRAASLVATGPVTIQTTGRFKAGAEATIAPESGAPRPVVHVAGSAAIFALSSTVEAAVLAPDETLKVGKLATFDGCLGASKAKAGLGSALRCSS